MNPKKRTPRVSKTFTPRVEEVSKEPLILAEYASPSLTLVHFRPMECNVSAERMRIPASFILMDSGGVVRIKTDWIEHSVILILQSLAINRQPRFTKQALEVVVRRLRETCRTCPDFDPKLFSGAYDDPQEPY